jgi:hypothetical protein
MTIFEQSKSDAQCVPMFPATVMAAPGDEEQVFRGYLKWRGKTLSRRRTGVGVNWDHICKWFMRTFPVYCPC